MSNLSIFQFDDAGGVVVNVRTVTAESGEVLFVGKDVCIALGYVDATTAIRSHCKGAQILHPLQTAGGMQEVRVLTEADVLRLIVSSNLPKAQAFERWVFEDVLPSIRKTGSYTAPQAQQASAEELELKLLNMAADFLNVSPSSRLQMIGGFMQLRAPAMAPLLPAYTIDAPSTHTAGSSQPTASVTELLKKHGVTISAAKFNQLLADAGIIEQLTRPSTSKGQKAFWSITQAGERYGKNVTSPRNQRETQPHWYVGQFGALLELLMGVA